MLGASPISCTECDSASPETVALENRALGLVPKSTRDVADSLVDQVTVAALGARRGRHGGNDRRRGVDGIARLILPAVDVNIA